jgi:FixJ family two-component response regulator
MNHGRDVAKSPSIPLPVVIIVDDDAALLGALKFAFEIDGFAVRTYATGDAVFGDAGLGDCACFIIDQKLPGLSGLEVVAALRQRRIAAPAILITSHPSIMLQERAARAGVPIVEKPLLGSTLLDRVRDAITRTPMQQ